MLKKLHLFIGILTLICFALTGQYMDKVLNHLQEMSNFNRALFRAGHIYILFMGFIHVSLGAYLQSFKHKILKTLQHIASSVFILSTLLMILSFFIDLPSETIERPLARYSLYLALGSIVTHGLLSLFNTKT